MRLINIHNLQLSSFTDDSNTPPYAILSHTWGPDEVTLQDVLTLPRHQLNQRRGWDKVARFCEAVRVNSGRLLGRDVHYAWADTCCIDKTSSAELSEAINSMFRWYRNAAACFVLLEDVEINSRGLGTVGDDFERSRWFTRGWTLQELVAPQDLYFFDTMWECIGDKLSLAERVSQRTSIDLDVILTGTWDDTCIAHRMAWAAGRKTTRREDMAYCLLGIFDVNMPLLYGEGDRAFIRLQEEILKESDDQSILAWDASTKDVSLDGIGALATHPSQFHAGAAIEALPSDGKPISLTQRGIQIHLQITTQESVTTTPGHRQEAMVAMLNCRYANDLSSRIGVPLRASLGSVTSRHLSGPHDASSQFVRTRAAPMPIPLQGVRFNVPNFISLVKRDQTATAVDQTVRRCWVRFWGVDSKGFKPVVWEPIEQWHVSPARSMTMMLPRRELDSAVTAAVAFMGEESPDTVYCLVLRLEPSKGSGKLGMRVLENSDESLQSRLMKLTEDAQSIADSTEAKAQLDPRKIATAKLTVTHESLSTFEIALASR